MILGFDPGREKCGIAVMEQANPPTQEPTIAYAEVVPAEQAIDVVHTLLNRYPISTIVMGDQTMSQTWQTKLEQSLREQRSDYATDSQNRSSALNDERPVQVVLIDERYSTLEARSRYWVIHPPKGLKTIVPQALRSIPRPIDDVVAIILIERYWQTLETQSETLSVSSVP